MQSEVNKPPLEFQKFASRLRSLRQKAGLTQEQLAAKVGVRPSTVSSWEVAYRVPELAAACMLADFFGVSLDYLLGRSDDLSPGACSGTSHMLEEALVLYTRINRLPARARNKILQELEWWEKQGVKQGKP